MKTSAKKLVGQALLWLGYQPYQLERGVSLCKTFWSLVLLVPIFALGRGIGRWFVWTGLNELSDKLDWDPSIPKVSNRTMFLRSLTGPFCLAFVFEFFAKKYNLIGWIPFWSLPLLAWLFLSVIVWLLLRSHKDRFNRKPRKVRTEPSSFEQFVEIVGAGIYALYKKVCPIIVFEGKFHWNPERKAWQETESSSVIDQHEQI